MVEDDGDAADGDEHQQNDGVDEEFQAEQLVERALDFRSVIGEHFVGEERLVAEDGLVRQDGDLDADDEAEQESLEHEAAHLGGRVRHQTGGHDGQDGAQEDGVAAAQRDDPRQTHRAARLQKVEETDEEHEQHGQHEKEEEVARTVVQTRAADVRQQQIGHQNEDDAQHGNGTDEHDVELGAQDQLQVRADVHVGAQTVETLGRFDGHAHVVVGDELVFVDVAHIHDAVFQQVGDREQLVVDRYVLG